MSRHAREIRSRTARKSVRRLVVFILLLGCLGCLFLWKNSGIGLVSLSFSDVSWRVFKNLNENTGTVSAFATIVLVAITGFYTIATFRLVSVTRELHAIQIRPLFSMSATVTSFEWAETPPTRGYVQFEVEFVNFGPSPAINTRFSPSIPVLDSTGKMLHFMTTFPKPEPAKILHQNQICACTFNLHADYFNEKTFAKDFLELELIYEDGGSNLYHCCESFWFVDMQKSSDRSYKLLLSKDYEALHLLKAQDRTSIASSSSAWWHGDKSVTIYERANIFSP